MKKEYVNPTMLVISVGNEDAITTSGTLEHEDTGDAVSKLDLSLILK